MKIWILLLIPIAAVIVMLMFYKKKIAIWEYLTLFGASFLIILISKLIITSSMTSDIEFHSESAYKVEYEGSWSEWIIDECSYDCFCSTNDDGYETCMTCWEDCSYRKYHSDSWRIVSKSGTSQNISESDYKRISKKWGEKKIGTHSGLKVNNDNGIYEAICPNESPEMLECIVTKHSYENKVQYSNSEYGFEEISDEDVKVYNLYEYPNIYEKYKQNHILGAGDATKNEAIKNMNVLNAQLGPKKQVQAFILIFKNQSVETGKMQEGYWKGGNKNEFVLTIGVDSDNKIEWAYPFTWSEEESVKKNIKRHVMNQSDLNLADISEYMYEELDKSFVRKPFADFDYLTVEPSSRAINISMIILMAFTIGFVIWSIMNGHDAKFGVENKTRHDRYKF